LSLRLFFFNARDNTCSNVGRLIIKAGISE
jgi:hypothetical protein